MPRPPCNPDPRVPKTGQESAVSGDVTPTEVSLGTRVVAEETETREEKQEEEEQEKEGEEKEGEEKEGEEKEEKERKVETRESFGTPTTETSAGARCLAG